VQLREKVIANINREMEMIDDQLDETNSIIRALEKDLQELKGEYAGMLYNMYKNRSSLNQLIFLFNARGFNDAIARVRYLQQFGDFRKKQAQLIEETKETLERKRQEQVGRKAEKQKLLADEEAQRSKLDEEMKEVDKMIASLKQQERKLNQDIQKKQQDADLLSRKIEELILKEIEAAKKKAEEEAAAKAKTTTPAKAGTKTSVLSATPEAAKLSADFASNQGRLPWPVEQGIISETFGTHPHPVLKYVTVVNNGIDIKTKENAQVRSLFQGTVVTVMYNPGFQRAVMVRHGEYFTVYSNLKEVFVRSGEEITTKQPIGLVYTDEKEGASKVHLEIWKNTQKLNPALWIYPNNQ
jgi:septal ring factor EnvC (AmiA/AmiB activator)